MPWGRNSSTAKMIPKDTASAQVPRLFDNIAVSAMRAGHFGHETLGMNGADAGRRVESLLSNASRSMAVAP